jgi:hypothetical protein
LGFVTRCRARFGGAGHGLDERHRSDGRSTTQHRRGRRGQTRAGATTGKVETHKGRRAETWSLTRASSFARHDSSAEGLHVPELRLAGLFRPLPRALWRHWFWATNFPDERDFHLRVGRSRDVALFSRHAFLVIQNPLAVVLGHASSPRPKLSRRRSLWKPLPLHGGHGGRNAPCPARRPYDPSRGMRQRRLVKPSRSRKQRYGSIDSPIRAESRVLWAFTLSPSPALAS